MDTNLPVTYFLSSPRSGTLTTTPANQGIQEVLVKQKPLSRSLKDNSHMPNIQDICLYALLAYRSTPVDAHLCSQAEMLYQRTIHTTLPQRIHHKDPHAGDGHDQLNQCVTQCAEHHNPHCRPKSPLYAGQTILSSMTTGPYGSQTRSSVKLPMAPTSYRLQVEDSTDMHMITSMNVTTHPPQQL